MNVFCRIRTLVKSVFVAFAAGAVAGFLTATGGAGAQPAPVSSDSVSFSAPAWVQR